MKFNQFLCASILLGSVAAADASGPLAVSPVKVNDPSSTDLTSRLLTVPRQEIRGLSLSESTQPEKLTIKRETVLVEEDFNNCPDGHTETIGHLGERYTDYLASGYFPTVDGYVSNYNSRQRHMDRRFRHGRERGAQSSFNAIIQSCLHT